MKTKRVGFIVMWWPCIDDTACVPQTLMHPANAPKDGVLFPAIDGVKFLDVTVFSSRKEAREAIRRTDLYGKLFHPNGYDRAMDFRVLPVAERRTDTNEVVK